MQRGHIALYDWVLRLRQKNSHEPAPHVALKAVVGSSPNAALGIPDGEEGIETNVVPL